MIRLLASLLLLSLSAARSQGEDVSALKKRLTDAADQSAIDRAGLQPWHLKLTVQLTTGAAAAPLDGTIEEWWASPNSWRVTYDLPDYKATELHSGDTLFRTSGATFPPHQLVTLLHQVVDPMAEAEDLNGVTPDLRQDTVGGVKLDCLMLDRPIANVAYPPLGLFPTFCFDPGKTTLRVWYDFGSQTVLRNKLGQFQTRSVATSIKVLETPPEAATATVTTLATLPVAKMELSPGADMTAVQVDTIPLDGKLVAVRAKVKVAPTYPESARRGHVSGTVFLKAVVGQDGHVHSLRVTSAPSADLALSALTAARKWTYEPYLINGEPVEVNTTLEVRYGFH